MDLDRPKLLRSCPSDPKERVLYLLKNLGPLTFNEMKNNRLKKQHITELVAEGEIMLIKEHPPTWDLVEFDETSY